jgi:hypothetical protein
MTEEYLWQPFTYNKHFEISTVYPHPIRKKGEDINAEEKYIDELKCFVVDIDGKIYSKAYLIALQFVDGVDESANIQKK